MRRQILAAAFVMFGAGVIGGEAFAQPTQVVDDKDLGVRLAIPKDWTWRSRDRDVFVNCAPKIESRPGMPGCYIALQKIKAGPGQTSITDADRAKWKSWTSADGMRQIVSTRDLKVAGFPAFEVIAKDGKQRAPRVFVLVPGLGVIDAWLYASWQDQDQSARFDPAFRAALDSLKPVK
jgi:hypothetical protein